MRATAPNVGAAAFDLNADSRAPAAADWEPAQGNVVRLLTLGESSGQIMSGPDAKGKYSVKVCGSFIREGAASVVMIMLSQTRDGVCISFCEPAEVMMCNYSQWAAHMARLCKGLMQRRNCL